jgi:hypothetical protein
VRRRRLRLAQRLARVLLAHAVLAGGRRGRRGGGGGGQEGRGPGSKGGCPGQSSRPPGARPVLHRCWRWQASRARRGGMAGEGEGVGECTKPTHARERAPHARTRAKPT